jgi:hypothetical protein
MAELGQLVSQVREAGRAFEHARELTRRTFVAQLGERSGHAHSEVPDRFLPRQQGRNQHPALGALQAGKEAGAKQRGLPAAGGTDDRGETARPTLEGRLQQPHQPLRLVVAPEEDPRILPGEGHQPWIRRPAGIPDPRFRPEARRPETHAQSGERLLPLNLGQIDPLDVVQ